ncbi:Alpha amylase, catalytic domain [Tenacibaculum sp. MAR_2009_124]|uniref:alpha-amylase family glycosyl hydrolase n=1 Tax=Tenacibaculum sp. MAR_2009_124 TaxID=1250059 RepID=UPI0008986A05|nr:alpha-amylase family glycosyl hydrolase [Tenacibaculum sp. MAR_2009_124]SEB48807.1 Alpha amylase, catalytic domain [Tenacibaculum sp. MAR_2009_124]
MRKITILLIGFTFILGACKKETKQVKQPKKKASKALSYAEEELENAIIYEANIRQYSEKGTFDEFTKNIPELKKLGVKIIWLMPIFPISETNRKATGDKFAHEFPEEERKRYLGSYYAVSDFKKINPEFGTIEDFRKLIKTAHDNEMFVILDWVPNHTGWDHGWLQSNPDFYTKNDKGEITDPLNEDGTSKGWNDVADLNYENPELRKTMIHDMLYWIENENIDGFRCDVAGSVPTSFWEEAIPQIRAKKNVFMLAEAWEPELLQGNLFDMGYGWDRHHTMNHIAKDEKSVEEWDITFNKDAERYEEDDILMTFITNHDENSWNGTIQERMGEASELFTVLSYVAPGMPLIYSGQEYGLKHRLKFFEKDQISHEKGKEWEVLKKLGKLKTDNIALHGGKKAASYSRLTSNDNVLIFKRKNKDKELIFIGNLSSEPTKQVLKLDMQYTDFFHQQIIDKTTKEIELGAWEYKVLIN